MTGCIPEAKLEGHGRQTTLFTILLVLKPAGVIFLKKRDHQKRVR